MGQLLDATRQYVMNEYDAHFARPISMYANLLPPLGFIGSTGGMLILFLSIHLANGALELGALALALTSSIFALVGFAALESVKIRLYRRLLGSLDHAWSLWRKLEAESARGQLRVRFPEFDDEGGRVDGFAPEQRVGDRKNRSPVDDHAVVLIAGP